MDARQPPPDALVPARAYDLERLEQMPAWVGLELTDEQKDVIREATGHEGDVLFLHLAELLTDRFERD